METQFEGNAERYVTCLLCSLLNIFFQQKVMEEHESKSFPQRRDSSDNNHQYYLQYKKLYEQALGLSHYLKKMNKRQQQIFEHIGELVIKGEGFRDIIRPDSEEFRKKKNRRTADEIHKEYSCPHERCDHKYGTEASLRIHIKKKHPELYQPKKRGKAKKEESAFFSGENS